MNRLPLGYLRFGDRPGGSGLRAEVTDLRMDREILQKAGASFARETNR